MNFEKPSLRCLNIYGKGECLNDLSISVPFYNHIRICDIAVNSFLAILIICSHGMKFIQSYEYQ